MVNMDNQTQSKSLTDWSEAQLLESLRSLNTQHSYDSVTRELDARARNKQADANIELTRQMANYARLQTITAMLSAGIALLALLKAFKVI